MLQIAVSADPARRDRRPRTGASAPIRRYNAWAAGLPLARRFALELGVLAVVALAARAIQFGNPAIQVDEQFYLLVGDRMLHGALPYVDIWDRKPVGLFLVYAAIRLLGGGGIIQYQLVATACAIATALIVTRAAGRVARPAGALAAGLLYLLYLDVFGGDGGQAPVFFNLPVAAAGVLIGSLSARPQFDARARWTACAAMLLVGLAIQIKTSAVLEGGFFGLALIVVAADRRMGAHRIVSWAFLWAALALLPTLAAFTAYAAMGHADTFVFANFQSIFTRGHPAGSAGQRLLHIVLLLAPLGLAAGIARSASRRESSRHWHRFNQAWAVAACLAVLLFGDYFDHYALPLLAPLALAGAPVLDDAGAALGVIWRQRSLVLPLGVAAFATAIIAAGCIVADNRHGRGTGPEQERIAAFLRPRLGSGCAFVYDGEPILYYLTGSCLPSRWPFPDHLNNISEDHAIGVDPLAEVERIMATRPRYVVSADSAERKMNWLTWDYMVGTLARDYRPVLAVRVGKRHRVVYERVAG